MSQKREFGSFSLTKDSKLKKSKMELEEEVIYKYINILLFI